MCLERNFRGFPTTLSFLCSPVSDTTPFLCLSLRLLVSDENGIPLSRSSLIGLVSCDWFFYFLCFDLLSHPVSTTES